MRYLLSTLLSGLLLYAPHAISGPYEDGGIAHYNDKKLTSFISQTRISANSGDAVAQFDLAYLYARGMGLSQNHHKAMSWFKKSAQQGLPRAQNHLGLAYIEARGGIEQNYSKAAEWFQKSAMQGDAEGAYLLAGLYVRGRGVVQSHANAQQWLLKAAEQNHAFAQLSLGLNYSKGRGVKVNKSLAHMWFTLSAQNGSGFGREYGNKLAQTMSKEELKEAEEIRKQWLAAQPKL